MVTSLLLHCYYVALRSLLLHIIITSLSHHYHIIIMSYYIFHYNTLLRHCLILLNWLLSRIISKSLLRIIASLLHHYYTIITKLQCYIIITSEALLQKGSRVIPSLRVTVMQRVRFHYYITITTNHYVIIRKGPIIPHFYIFQSPELAHGGRASHATPHGRRDTSATFGKEGSIWPPTASSSMSFTTLVDMHVLQPVTVDPAHPAIWVVVFLLKLVCAEKCSLKLRLNTKHLLDFLISDFISNRRRRFDRPSVVSKFKF